MTPSLSSEAGRRLRDDLGQPESAEGYAALRQRLVLNAISDRARRARNRRLAWAGSCVALALVLWFGLRTTSRVREESALAFYAGEAGELGRVGAYYTASADSPLLLRFAEGSRVHVEGGGGLRISGARSSRVSVQLETGAAQFDVVPRRGSEWEIFAGPYRVRVTGTSFLLAWDADAQTLDLRMQTGSVLVSGPGIEHGQRVQGTEHFMTRVSSSRSSDAADSSDSEAAPAASAAVSPRVSEEPVAEDALAEEPLAEAPLAEEPSSPAPASAPDGPAERPASTNEPGRRRGETTGAVDSAARQQNALAQIETVERGGTERFLSSAGAEQLMSLADSARFARKGALATRALQAVRSRFAGSRASASAAFLLGRMAEDAGNLRQALQLYDAHAQESGELVPEALGRKMLVLHRLGETERRDGVAREYLQRFPKGAYAPQARELLAR